MQKWFEDSLIRVLRLRKINVHVYNYVEYMWRNIIGQYARIIVNWIFFSHFTD